MLTHQPILETLDTVLRARTVADQWNLLLDIMAGYGFDRLFFASTRFGTDQHWGAKSDWLMLTNHNPEVVQSFIGENIYLETAKIHSPPEGRAGSYSWALRPVRAQDEMTLAEIKHRDVCDRNGVVSGYTLWFPETCSRSKSVMGLCARPGLSQAEVDEGWKIHGSELWVLANVVQLKLAILPNPDREKRLTSRQKQALAWVADGKAGRDIAVIMGLSLVTVEKHLRQAREALGVDTTAEAVKKAAMLNHLHFA